MEQNAEFKFPNFTILAQIATFIGIANLIIDLLAIWNFGKPLNQPIINNALISNLKNLTYIVGLYFALKWFHNQNPKNNFFRYLWFILSIGALSSLFDIFFYAVYFKYIQPEAIINLVEEIINLHPDFEVIRDVLIENFVFIFSLSIFMSYLVQFLFFGLIFVLIFKLFFKK